MLNKMANNDFLLKVRFDQNRDIRKLFKYFSWFKIQSVLSRLL